jgi:hypothetical protein
MAIVATTNRGLVAPPHDVCATTSGSSKSDLVSAPIHGQHRQDPDLLQLSARGEVVDALQSTPHSGGYYRVSATYWPTGY